MLSNRADDCPFCNLSEDRIIKKSDLLISFWDKFPISKGHALIIPKRHISRFSEATSDELRAIWYLVEDVTKLIENQFQPDGFNFGMNDGEAAGQTVMHFHFHIVPRYTGDVVDPRGGVRWILPQKARYWS